MDYLLLFRLVHLTPWLSTLLTTFPPNISVGTRWDCISKGHQDQMRLHSINWLGLDESALHELKGTKWDCTPKIKGDYIRVHSMNWNELHESAFQKVFRTTWECIRFWFGLYKSAFNFFDPDHIRVHSWKKTFSRAFPPNPWLVSGTDIFSLIIFIPMSKP